MAPAPQLLSHYFEAILSDQFDAYVWFAETSAVNGNRGKFPGKQAQHLWFAIAKFSNIKLLRDSMMKDHGRISWFAREFAPVTR